MAHARTTDKEARVVEQCARGRFARYTASVPVIIAQDRVTIDADSHLLADAIKNETIYKGLYVAPCDGKVVRCFVNAIAYGVIASSTATIKFSKAVIGATDVDLTSTITVAATAAPTAKTAIDGTLATTAGYLDLVEGQLVYITIAVANQNVTTKTSGLIAGIEFVPTDKSYAGS